jgi:hypothetical protein
MILQISRDSLSSDAMSAILSIEKTLSAFPPDEQLLIAKECVVSVLRELRLVSENEHTEARVCIWGTRCSSRHPLPDERHHQKFVFPSNYTHGCGPRKKTPIRSS